MTKKTLVFCFFLAAFFPSFALPASAEPSCEGEELQSCLHIGQSLMDAGQNEAALDLFLKATRKNPDHAESFHKLGNVYSQMQRYEDALQAFQKAVARDSQSWKSLYGIGYSYIQRAGPHPKSPEYHKKALDAFYASFKIHPDHAITSELICMIHVEHGEYEECHDHFVKFTQISKAPYTAMFIKMAAISVKNLGDLRRFFAYVRQAYQHYPEDYFFTYYTAFDDLYRRHPEDAAEKLRFLKTVPRDGLNDHLEKSLDLARLEAFIKEPESIFRDLSSPEA